LAQMGEHQIFFESCQKKKDSVHLFRLWTACELNFSLFSEN
jgi:hypothetical protein